MDIQNKILTRGGEFIVRETNCEEIFTPEDFNDEQKMMREAVKEFADKEIWSKNCLLYTSPSPRDAESSRMPSSA